MSSSPIAPTSTTGSSIAVPSLRVRPRPRWPTAVPETALAGDCGAAGDCALPEAGQVAVIACGALGGHVREIAARRGWAIELHCLPSLLHNHPDRIAPAAEQLARDLQGRGLRVALGYADCGSYGALDSLCERLGLRRLPGCTATTCWPGRAGCGRCSRRSPARTC
jgi:hypothetical protein